MNAVLSLDLNGNVDGFSETEVIVAAHPVKNENKANTNSCNQAHEKRVDESKLETLSKHQMHVKGARKCCQCAYNSGYQQGALLQHFISLDIDSLGDASPDNDGQYKSIHQAFALGYRDGVNSFLKS